jgi:hypothetical protein
MLIVMDKDAILVVSGTGEVIAPDDDLIYYSVSTTILSLVKTQISAATFKLSYAISSADKCDG